MRVASTGRDGNPSVPSLKSMMEVGELSIQALEMFASRFLQHAVERYHAKE